MLNAEKYKDVGWKIDNNSSFIKDSFNGFFYNWIDIRLFFKIPEDLKK